MGFDEWLGSLFNQKSINNKEIAITIWAVWYSSNKLLHEKKSHSVEGIVTFIRGFGKEFFEVVVPSTHHNPRSIIKREPLPDNWVKINVDASFSTTTHMATTSFIIRNNAGQVMGSGFRFHHLVSSVALAEALATLDGLKFAKDLGFTLVIL